MKGWYLHKQRASLQKKKDIRGLQNSIKAGSEEKKKGMGGREGREGGKKMDSEKGFSK